MTTSKHDKGVLSLEERLLNSGFTTHTFVEYGKGEIDLYAEKDGYRVCVEFKCHLGVKNYRYAHNQLERMNRFYFKDNKRTFNLVASYEDKHSDKLYIEWVDPSNPKYML